MATFRKDMLGKTGGHAVGQINSWNYDTVINGALVTETEGIDNFTLGELHYTGGVQSVKQATADAEAEDMVLIATPEERLEGEPLENFYNAKGEMAKCVILSQNLEFQTSAVATVDSVNIGDKMIWDATAKKFKKDDGAVATAKKVFRVVEIEKDEFYSIDGKTLVALRVIK